MIRIVVRTVYAIPDGTHSGNAIRTFDFDLPDLEKYLEELIPYGGRWVDGVEVLPRVAQKEAE